MGPRFEPKPKLHVHMSVTRVILWCPHELAWKITDTLKEPRVEPPKNLQKKHWCVRHMFPYDINPGGQPTGTYAGEFSLVSLKVERLNPYRSFDIVHCIRVKYVGGVCGNHVLTHLPYLSTIRNVFREAREPVQLCSTRLYATQ